MKNRPVYCDGNIIGTVVPCCENCLHEKYDSSVYPSKIDCKYKDERVMHYKTVLGKKFASFEGCDNFEERGAC